MSSAATPQSRQGECAGIGLELKAEKSMAVATRSQKDQCEHDAHDHSERAASEGLRERLERRVPEHPAEEKRAGRHAEYQSCRSRAQEQGSLTESEHRAEKTPGSGQVRS